MSAELRIPEGIVVRTARGGPDVLRVILTDLKQYSFSGYIKVVLKKQTLNSTGYLVIDQGKPSMSIYQFEKTEPREIKRIYAGDKSMRYVWEDSQDKQSLIELHSRVPKEEFDRRFPDAKLIDMEEIKTRMARLSPSSKPEVQETPEPEPQGIEEEGAEKEKDATYQEIEKWRQEGYIVTKLEETYGISRQSAKKEVAKYQERIKELKKLERLLDNMPHVGMDEEIEQLKGRLNDPSGLETIKADYEKLKEKVRKQIEQTKVAERKIEEDLKKKKREEQVGDLYELILQYQRGEASKKDAPACEKCGSVLDEKGACPKCADKELAEKKMALPPDAQAFESFVVGASNKFAHAAAIAVAQAPDKAYNPLYLYGKSGLGKTHLLTAIARQLMNSHSPGGVAFISAEKFAEDLDRAMKKDAVSEFRDQLRNKIGLLIDDFQFLAGKDSAQGELLYILEETKRGGGQIVIASDRLPKEIPHLSEQLSVKIQGGLIADIQPPDEATRMEILRRKAKEKGRDIPESVIKFIAENVSSNVRELEAALNRLIAFSTVMKLDIDLQLSKEVLIPTLSPESTKAEEGVDFDVKAGHSYLIEEDRPVTSNKLLAKKLKDGFKGLEITRMNPAQVRQDYGIAAEILWLTDKDSKNEKTISPSLEMIVHTIEGFMQSNVKGILLLDGLQYLISNTNFDGVLRFLRRLIDDFSESQSIMMISVSPGTLKQQELSILERELETIRPQV